MNVFSINIAGVGSDEKLHYTIQNCKILSKGEDFILLIQESKIQDFKQSQLNILERFKLNYYLSPAVNRSGGLITLWSKTLGKTQCLTDSESFTSLLFPTLHIKVINVYLNYHDFASKLQTLDESLNDYSDITTIMGGDLNAFSHDQRNTSSTLKSDDQRITRFNSIIQVLEKHSLMDFAANCNQIEYTRYDKRVKTFSRIDYFLTSLDNPYDSMSVHNHAMSDHFLLQLSRKEARERGTGYWKLNESILLPNRYFLVEEIRNFDFSADVLVEYERHKNTLRDILRLLGINKYRIDCEQVDRLKSKRCKLISKIQNGSFDDQDLKHFHQTRQDLNRLEIEEEKFALKSHKKLLFHTQQGNSEALKTWFSNGNSMNNIHNLRLKNGSVTTSTNSILNEFESHFTDLYKNVRTEGSNDWITKFAERNQIDPNNLPVGQITEQEVLTCIGKLNSRSSPGVDGITSNFYKVFRKDIAPLLTHVYNKCTLGGQLTEGFELSVLKLIPKKDFSISVNDFRPISLLNTDLKILSHILAERLKNCLEDVIMKHQFAYLRGRQINTPLRLLNRLMKRKLRYNDCIVNLDFSKAFDRIDRSFFLELLMKIGLDSFTLKAISCMYRRTSSFVEVNGYLSRSITIERGVRQGCPLSALLFILSIEPLLQQIQSSQFLKSFNNQRVSAYADDITCYIKQSSLEGLFDLVADFCDATQLAVNKDKSEVLTKCNDPNVKCVRSTKILGVNFDIVKREANSILNTMKELIAEHRSKVMRCRSSRAKAIAINTFITPKFLHIARHTNFLESSLNKCQSLLGTLMKNGPKMEIATKYLILPPTQGGCGLVHLKTRIVAAKIIDLIVERTHIQDRTEIGRDFINNVNELGALFIDEGNSFSLMKFDDNDVTLDVFPTTKLCMVYDFLLFCGPFTGIIEDRLKISEQRFHCTNSDLTAFIKFTWKCKFLRVRT